MDIPAVSVELQRHGEVALLTLQRPEVGNAINDAIRHELPERVEQLDRDDAVRCIVLAGAGVRGFCVGADIKERRAVGNSVQERRRLIDNPWIERVARTRKPVVAALHGYCLGGGLELALACDIRIAAPDTVLGLPETGLGLIPGGGGTQRLPRLIGAARALDLILTGDRLSAADALALGLVTRLSANRDSLVEEALALAARVAARPPAATAYAKELVRGAGEIDLAAGLQQERALFSILMNTADRAEAAQAFAEKRPAKFGGH